MSELLEKVLLDLEAMGSIKFGEFTLKSGLKSPVYFDLRLMVSDPTLMKNISKLLLDFVFAHTSKSDVFALSKVAESKLAEETVSRTVILHPVSPDAVSKSDLLCGVPYTALPLATLMSVDCKKPMLIRRKEAKAYGTAQILEGKFAPGQRCLIVEDVITSGSSVLETAALLRGQGLIIDHAVVFLDRQQGGKTILNNAQIETASVTDITTLMQTLLKHGRIKQDVVDKVFEFLNNNKVKAETPESEAPPVTKVPLETRLLSANAALPISRLFQTMLEKKSNLCVAADLNSVAKILDLVNQIGDKICCLKLHYDIILDWAPDSGEILKTMAKKHNFLLMEDRKFFDIGNTVKQQMQPIAAWADLVTLVTLPGPAILDAVRLVQKEANRPFGALIVAEMSSKDNFFTADFSKKCVDLLNKYPDVAVGLVSQSRLEKSRSDIVQMTPGVKINDSEAPEDLGQQYDSPESAVLTRGADVIIVGRGITHSANPANAAETYRRAGWEGYLKRVNI